MTIAWLVIGTNRYFDLAIKCLESIKANYHGGQQQEFILFTDQGYKCTYDWVETVAIPHEPFPLVTLNRYQYFTLHDSLLSGYDSVSYTHLTLPTKA